MERESSQEYNALVNEITKGMEQVKQLRESSAGNEEVVLERMLASYEEALLILNGSASQGQCQSVVSSSPDSPDSSKSVNKVTEYEDSSRSSSPPRGKYKSRRKPLLEQIVRVKTRSLDASGESLDDGYSWRKYGQKSLLGSKHPRNYFRCVHKFDEGCPATKQVQRLSEEPPLIQTTYHGHHTCSPMPADPSPTLPEKQE